MPSELSFDKLAHFLGRAPDDRELINFLREIEVEAAIEPSDNFAYIECHRKGFDLTFEDEVVFFEKDEVPVGKLLLVAIHLYSEGQQGFKRFEGALPEGITFEEDMMGARNKLGVPAKTGGGKTKAGKWIPAWDRHTRDKYSIHLQYSSDLKRINVITLQLLTSR
jgi:hypothetical protein